MTRSETINELAAALALAQAEIAHARKESENPHFRHRYADLASVWDACRAALTKHGLSIVQSPRLVSGGELWLVEVETTLLHKSGESLSDTLAVPVSPASPQAVGSAITYARRYALAAFVGVAPEEDDANSATAPPPLRACDIAADRYPENVPEKKAPPKPPRRAAAKSATVKVLGIVKRLADGREKFIISADDEKTYFTFDLGQATDAKSAKAAGRPIVIDYVETADGREIGGMSAFAEAPEPSL